MANDSHFRLCDDADHDDDDDGDDDDDYDDDDSDDNDDDDDKIMDTYSHNYNEEN